MHNNRAWLYDGISEHIVAPKMAGLPSSSFLQPHRPLQDATLAGMVAKGHGITALCLFLALSRIELHLWLTRLNLPIPYDLAMKRRPLASTYWVSYEVSHLIALWERNLSSSSIAGSIGRTASAVRSKARWLGLPSRCRTDIISEPLPPLTVDIRYEPSVAPVSRKRQRWTDELYLPVIDRFLSYQHYRGIAFDLGLSPAQVRSKIKALGLPKNRERHLQTMDYRPYTREATALRSQYLIRKCPKLKQLYVTPRSGIQWHCPSYRKTLEYRCSEALGPENDSISHLSRAW